MRWKRLWADVRYPLWVFLFSKLYIGSFVYYGHMNKPPDTLQGSWEGVENWWLNPWTYYDSKWYLQIASQSYTEQTSVFFPLYPMIIKVFSMTGINQAISGVIIANLTFLWALIILQKLTCVDYTERISRTTMWVVALWPTAAFFSAVYTESLFLLLFVASFYMVRKGKWLWGAVFGGLAALTRNCGPLLLFVLTIEYLSSKGWELRETQKDVVWLAFILIGTLMYPVYLWWKFGNPSIFIEAQRYYLRPSVPELSRVWMGIYGDIQGLFNGEINISIIFHIIFTILAVTLVMVKFKEIRLSYSLFVVGIIIMNLVMARNSLPHTAGMIRYLNVAFPLAQVIAEMYERFPRLKPVLVAEWLMISAIVSIIFGMKGFWG